MPVLKIPALLIAHTSGQAEVTVNGATVAEALNDLIRQYPAIQPHVFNESGALSPFLSLYVGEQNIRNLQGVDTPIADGDKMMLIPSIAKG